MTRAECLNMATQATGGKRVTDYGKPENNFTMIADLWAAYLGCPVTALDVSMMMGLLKIARVRGSAGKPSDDCFVDLAGYAACGAEISANKK